MNKFLLSAMFAAGIATFASGANAATVACDPGYEDAITTNSGCEVGSQNNDNPLPGAVNADEFFGFEDWVYLAKDDGLNGSNVGGEDAGALTIDGTTSAGDWMINVGDTAYDYYMIVLKGGGGNIDPSQFVGYLIDVAVDGLSGTYETPFSNMNNGNGAAISHVTLYARAPGDGGGDDPDGEIPLPAAGWMLLAGVGGLAAMRRRRKAA